jgi:hypothetical protein
MGAGSPLAETRGMRNRTLLAAATACAALAIPSVASAEDFCVGGPAGCSGTPVPPPLLSFALTQAQSNGTDDRFILAPGIYASSQFGHQSGERVQIIGAGAGKTTLRGSMDAPVLELAGEQDTSVSDLTIEATGAATGGLTLHGTSARGVAVEATGAPSLLAGVSLYGDASFDDGSVDIGALERHAVVVWSGAGTVTDSTLTAPSGAGFVGGGSDATLRRSTVDAKFGVYAGAGHLTVSDTLVDLRGHAGPDPAFGLYVSPAAGGTSTAADADRLTVVGSTPTSSDTVGVATFAHGAGMSASARIRDSVISGIGVPVGRGANNGATANLTTDRSAYPSAVASFDTGPGSLVEQNRLKVSPGFVGSGDFHLAADSPLIDAGTPDGPPAGATDRDGKPRVSDGNGDCLPVSDIGAFEYQGAAAAACTPAPAPPATGGAVTAPAATTVPAPRISRLRVDPTRVQIGPALPKLVRTAVRRPLSTIRFRLSKPAIVTLRFAKLGRNGTARTLRPKLKIKARKGRNRIRFAARLTRNVALTPGAYRVTAVATTKAGARSKQGRARFTAINPTRR